MSTQTKPHPDLLLTTSPFLKKREDTKWIMWQVNMSLVPIVLAATYFFGIGSLLIIAAATAGAVLPEWLLSRGSTRNPIKDGSAVITGLLLGLTLPPTLPLWMAFVGGATAIGLGKLMFGGIGANIFNPALVGRAFLQAAFPAAMTTWVLQVQESGEGVLSAAPTLFAWPLLKSNVDAISAATPLAMMKFDAQPTPVSDLLFGGIAGSVGETSAALLLLAGAYLALRRVINWRVPVSIFGTVFIVAGLLHWIAPESYPSPWFHLFSGGLMLGAIYMATDPVTSPLTQRGIWVFGAGIGILVVVIRQFGGLPEGVMYAILLMNAFVPLINRATQPRTFGTPRAERWKVH